MGTLYREEVECCSKSILKGSIGTILGAFGVLALCFILGVMLFKDYYEMILIMAGIVAVFSTIKLKRRATRAYRYEIIDREVIIKDVTNGRRVVKLNFNARNIVTLDEIDTKYKGIEPIAREYNFVCNLKAKNKKRCIFERDGKLYSFRFEPSEAFINKIEILRLAK